MADNSNTLKGSRILVVDDRPENLKLLTAILENDGYIVFGANDGQEALKIVAEEALDLIVLDIMMPGLNGYQVCERIKQDSANADIPVIFISALTNIEERVKAFEVGGADYLMRPFHLEEVDARVRIHLIRRKQELEIRRLHEREKERNEQLGEIVAERTAQLNRLNHRMAAILASVTDAIILVAADGTIDMTNPSFDKLFGYFPDELFGQSITEIALSAHHQAISEAFELAYGGDAQTNIQVVALRKDGSTFDIDMSFAQVSVDEKHIVCNCHDISNLKEMERIKDNFVSMVTHELRTPITGILLIANQLLNYFDRMNEEQRLNKLKQLNAQSKIMAELVESVLDISRLEAQKNKLVTDQIDMSGIVQGIMEEMSLAAQEKEQALQLSRDPLPGGIEGDAVDLARIWRNLVSNAIKYTPSGGAVHVRLGSLEAEDSKIMEVSPSILALPWFSELELEHRLYCVGQVEDTGYGISAEELPHIFDRFHRGWAKQSDIPGTGLGLALVKELLNLFGGNIRADSQLKEGTIFTFWIPIVEEAVPD